MIKHPEVFFPQLSTVCLFVYLFIHLLFNFQNIVALRVYI